MFLHSQQRRVIGLDVAYIGTSTEECTCTGHRRSWKRVFGTQTKIPSTFSPKWGLNTTVWERGLSVSHEHKCGWVWWKPVSALPDKVLPYLWCVRSIDGEQVTGPNNAKIPSVIQWPKENRCTNWLNDCDSQKYQWSSEIVSVVKSEAVLTINQSENNISPRIEF